MKFYRNLIIYIATVILALFIIFGKRLRPPLLAENQLRILTYSSFAGKDGPGALLAQKFKEQTGVEVFWMGSSNAGLLLERLKFAGQRERPDLVLGLDQFAIFKAKQELNWSSTKNLYANIENSILPKSSEDYQFLPYDWGPLTFIHRAEEGPAPQTLDDLLLPQYREKLILQDPRLSSPGLQFLVWVLSYFGEDKGIQYLGELRKSIDVLYPSWTSSYSYFLSAKRGYVFSYFSSLLYHQQVEKDFGFRTVLMKHKHPVQVEYAGIPEGCRKCEGARSFLKFLVSKEAQIILKEKNYMFPVSGNALQADELKLIQGIEYISPLESWMLLRRKKQWMKKWKEIFY